MTPEFSRCCRAGLLPVAVIYSEALQDITAAAPTMPTCVPLRSLDRNSQSAGLAGAGRPMVEHVSEPPERGRGGACLGIPR